MNTVPRLLLLAALGCLLLLAGCGGDDPVSPAPLLPVYVDGTHGAPDAAGTATDPLSTIQAGIDLAADKGREVRVAQGLYLFEGTAAASVNLAPNVDVYGGYRNQDGTWTRDVAAYVTTLRDVSASGGTYDNPRRAVTGDFGARTGDGPVFDGFTVEGGGGDLSTGIFLGEDVTITLAHCVFVAGNATQGHGIKNYSTNRHSEALVTITDCTVRGGGGAQTTGIYVHDSNLQVLDTTVASLTATGSIFGIDCGYGDIRIEGCSIHGGYAPNTTHALYLNEAYRSTVTGCTINGGNGVTRSFGIQAMDTEDVSDITGNTIDAGTGEWCVALELGWVEVNPSVIGNTLRASGGRDRFGIYETGNTADPVSLHDNLFNASLLAGDGTSCYYHDVTDNIQTDFTDINQVNALDENGYNPANSCSGNVAVAR